MTKNTIKKVLGRSFITLSVLQTLVIEVEATLNDRPLTYLSFDAADPEPHLLYGWQIATLPHTVIEDDEIIDPNYAASWLTLCTC